MAQEQRVKGFKNIFGTHPGADCNGKSLPGVFVQDCQHLVTSTIAELVVHEVDSPDVVRMRRPQADDRTVFVIEPSALPVPLRKLQPFFAPEPLDPLVIDLPAFDAEQFRDLAIAIPTVLLRQPDQSQPQRIIIPLARLVLQGASRQTDHPACPSLRCRELLACVNDGLTELLCGQALGFR